MKKIACLIGLFFTVLTHAQQVNIIPQPVSLKINKGSFALNDKVQIAYDQSSELAARFLYDYLVKYYNLKCRITETGNALKDTRTIYLFSSEGDKGNYKLNIEQHSVEIKGDAAGVFYGVQTFIQLLPVGANISRVETPCVKIEDEPRFAYRGMHLDVGRHFFPVSFVKKYIDYIALHKMNYFHWHLTEDQGWRIEIKKYPRLTEVGAWRNGTIIGRYPGTGNDGIRYGGFYTQDEIKEVVKYAADRYITVVPEIEMPGHSSAAIAAYPFLSCFPNESTKHPPQCAWSGDSTGKQVQQTWGVFDDVFCAGKDSTFQFLQDVLDEVMVLFPSKYIHVGGDECPKANWKRCPQCQLRIKNEGLKDEHELQSYFIQRMEKYLNSKGRTLIGWDEILEGGLAPKAVVMSWRGEAGGIAAARQKHDVIMTPGGWCYFDHSQSQNEDSVTIGGYTTVEKVYSYEPIPDSLTSEQGKFVLGAQGNVWTEYMANERKVEYMIFPRMSALSEVLWSPKKDRDSVSFEKRLLTQFKRYDLWKTNYSKAYWDIKSSIIPTNNFNGIAWKLESKSADKIIRVNFWSSRNKIQINLPKEIEGKTWYVLSDAYLKDSTIYKSPLKINAHGFYEAILLEKRNNKLVSVGNPITQTFFFNKATGKKIILTNLPSPNYPGDGAFTLVNGVWNEKGLARSKEILGFSGDDLEAVIDIGKSQRVSNVIVHSLSSGGSWVYPPKYAEVFISSDGKKFTSVGKSENFVTTTGTNGTVTVSFTQVATRFVKILVKNLGIVPEGNRGAGNKAWLFVDEIEVF